MLIDYVLFLKCVAYCGYHPKKVKNNTVSITLWNCLHVVATYYTLHLKSFSKIIHNIKIKQLHIKDTSDNKVAQIHIKKELIRNVCFPFVTFIIQLFDA